MKHVLLLAMVVMTGCSGAQTHLWLAGYDEDAVRARCAAMKTNQRSQEAEWEIREREKWHRLDTFQKTYAALPMGPARWEYLAKVKAEREAREKEEAKTSEFTMHNTPYPPEVVETNINRCVAQSRGNALRATVPVVFTVPLVQ